MMVKKGINDLDKIMTERRLPYQVKFWWHFNLAIFRKIKCC